MIPIDALKIGDIVWSMGALNPFPSFVSDIRIDRPGEGAVWLSEDKIKTPGLTCSNNVLFRTYEELLLTCWEPKVLLPEQADQELKDAVSHAYNSGVGSEPAQQPDRDFEMLLAMLCHPGNAKHFQADPDILRLAHDAMRRFRKNYPDHSSFFDECDPQIQQKSVEEIQKNEPPPAPDPVHCDDGKWYFWDETWADRHGPYDTKDEAQYKLQKYINEVLGPPDEEKLAELFDKYRKTLKNVLISDPLFCRDETADLPPVTFAEAMAGVTRVMKKLGDTLGSVKNLCGEIPLESTPPDSNINEFVEALKPNGLAQRDCPDEATECFQCNLINLSPLSPDVIKKWAAGACVCQHVITFHDATPEETAKRDAAFDKEQEEMRAAEDDSFTMAVEDVNFLNLSGRDYPDQKTCQKCNVVDTKFLPELKIGAWARGECVCNYIKYRSHHTREHNFIGSRENFSKTVLSGARLDTIDRANPGPVPEIEITEIDEKPESWGEDSELETESRCDCGGPAGHLPGGSHCRKPEQQELL